MTKGLRTAAFAALLATGLAGCTATNITAHSSAIDHAGLHPDDRQESRMYHDHHGNGSRLPKSDHTSVKGDASKSYMAAGQEHFRNQNYGLAHENFEKAIEVSSDNASAWLGLAASLDQLGKFKTADRAYEQLVQLEKNNARVYNNMGYSYLLRGEYSKARSYLNRAQDIDPTLEEVQGNIHLLEKSLSS